MINKKYVPGNVSTVCRYRCNVVFCGNVLSAWTQHNKSNFLDFSILTTSKYKQVSVSMSLYSAFHAAEHFKNPEAFVPERWLNESDEYANDKKEAFQPYSYGPRNCLGQQ